MARRVNQSCKDEGPLTLDRSWTVDEEISGHVIDFLDRNDPKKTNKPFFRRAIIVCVSRRTSLGKYLRSTTSVGLNAQISFTTSW